MGSLGDVSMNTFSLFFGFILDQYGTFLYRTLATIVLSFGFLFFMVAVKVHWYMFMGIILKSAGSFSLLMSHDQPSISCIDWSLDKQSYRFHHHAFDCGHLCFRLAYNLRFV